jgi:uncharacterized membrane protein
MKKDDLYLIGFIALIIISALFNYIIYPIYNFFDGFYGGWIVFSVIALSARLFFVYRDTEIIVDNTNGLRKFIQKITFGKYIYCRTFW